MGVYKHGAWDAVYRITSNLDADIMKGMIKTLKVVTIDAEARALRHMRNQDLNWVPYRNPNYAAQKAKRGLSSKQLFATSTMFQNITSIVKKDKGFVGVKRNVKSKTGQKLTSIAAVHEFGSERRNIDARPLWRPTLKEVYVDAKRKKIALNHVLKNIRKRSGR